MIGNPKYKHDDVVSFDITIDGIARTFTGTIYIVDAYGTFEQNEEPSYDIMVDNWDNTGEPVFVKHIRESAIKL